VSDRYRVVHSVGGALDSVGASGLVRVFRRTTTVVTAYALLQTEVGSVKPTLDAVASDLAGLSR
jgi:hypothetical protein